MSNRSIDRVGQVFGDLTVVARAPRHEFITAWDCRCVCGRRVRVHCSSLVSGKTRSCGCLRRRLAIARRDPFAPEPRIFLPSRVLFDAHAAVLLVLDRGGVMSPQEIAAVLGRNPSSTRRVLHNLRRRRLVQCIERARLGSCGTGARFGLTWRAAPEIERSANMWPEIADDVEARMRAREVAA